MLPLRQNNPLAPAVYNGVSGIGYDAQGRSYQDALFVKSFTVALAANQFLPNQVVQFDQGADFILEAVVLTNQSPSAMGVRFSDSTGFQISDQFLGAFGFGAVPVLAHLFVLPIPLYLPSGSALIIDLIELAGATPTVQFLFMGRKRFPSPNDSEIAYKQRLDNTSDGWTLTSAVIPNRYSYQALCVSAMDAIRAANNYKPKIYGIPDITTFYPNGLAPFTDYVTQVRMLPGTIVLGMSMGLSGSSTWQLPDNFYINVTDDATGIPFFSDWLAELMFNVPVLWQGDGLFPPFQDIQDYVAKTAWLPLTRPRPILSPGVVTVEMCFKGTPSSTNPIFPQLTLLCVEPCNVMRNQGECE